MTNKQKAFITEYLKDKNCTQSAIRAGYSSKTAYSIGQENLRKPEIKAEIQKLMDIAINKALVSVEYVIEGLKEVSERCMNKVPVMEFDRAKKRYVQKQDENGKDVWGFDSAGANKSLELLGKYLNVFKGDNTDTNTNVYFTYYHKPKDKDKNINNIPPSRTFLDREIGK